MSHDRITNTVRTSVQLPHPSGLLRTLMRFPILLYRLNLGWLLGKRFLLLEHRGRRSGIVRQAVIEVVDHDAQKGSYVAAAAWGRRSDWYKNIEVEPRVNIRVGAQRFAAYARTLPAADAARHLNTYAAAHPFAFRQLGSMLIGSRSHDTPRLVQSFVAAVPFVEFVPAGENGS